MPNKKPTNKRPPLSELQHIIEPLRDLAVPIDSLVVDPQNARLHGDGNLTSIVRSLQEFGQRKPIVVNQNGNVIEAGNGTYQAALQLGWKYLAAVLVQDDEATARGFALADNRTAELAEWDVEQLELQLAVLETDNPDLYDDLLFDQLRAAEEAEAAAAGESVEVPECYQVAVECKDEAAQKKLFEEMKKRGFECKLLTM